MNGDIWKPASHLQDQDINSRALDAISAVIEDGDYIDGARMVKVAVDRKLGLSRI